LFELAIRNLLGRGGQEHDLGQDDQRDKSGKENYPLTFHGRPFSFLVLRKIKNIRSGEEKPHLRQRRKSFYSGFHLSEETYRFLSRRPG
jgi:hypothetical protein